ncbi:hypothetical protein RMSM_04268 [Rhodopirellula maiorica SM1]|uniref:Uncharacterized protein n=1 Tax=Rhodopirellula maiorica SM1 TaxID=1265738 RepID=M5RHM6_9BACT|nr:hypothetical protein RMSM_04268 [Rhodopirellula maiorica SM1]
MGLAKVPGVSTAKMGILANWARAVTQTNQANGLARNLRVAIRMQ